MARISRQIGWSNESNILYQILNQLTRLAGIITGLKPVPNPFCYLELVFDDPSYFPYTTLADYNANTTHDEPFTALVPVGNTQRLYGGKNVNLIGIFGGNDHLLSITDQCGVVTELVSIGNAYNLIQVILPSLTSLNNYAFENCTSLTTISLPSVTSISDGAFSGCSSLVSASFPNATFIGNYALEACVSLTSVSLPKVETMGSSSFSNTTSLTSISLPNLTYMDETAFSNLGTLVSISLPKITFISLNAFDGCTSLTTVLAPNVTILASGAFASCISLNNISFPKLTEIGAGAFSSTGLIIANFPLVTYVGPGAFYNDQALTTINLNSVTNLGGTPVDNGVFDNITGNTITLTVPVAQQTIDDGDPDGDIVYLDSNNTLTVNYI